MKNNEEKIKAFLSDEKKVRTLANDDEFIEKVSGGEATPETYQKEFEKFGIRISDQDAAQTKNVVDNIFEKSAENLGDEFLGSVSGGGAGVNVLAKMTTAASLTAGLGCSIAACVYSAKANKAKTEGNHSDYDKYIHKSHNCGIATATLVGVASISGLTANFTPTLHEIGYKEQADRLSR